MSATEPKDLMDVLAKLEHHRADPTPDSPDAQRRFRRFVVRGDALLESMDLSMTREPLNVLLRDVSQGGVGFLSDQFIEPCTEWRVRFQAQGRIVGSQPVIIRFCRLVQDGLYLIGAQFVIEPYLMAALGVSEQELREQNICSYGNLDVSEFEAPDNRAS